MSNIFNIPISELIKLRRSVRTFSDRAVPADLTEEIAGYLETLSGPFPANVRFRLLNLLFRNKGMCWVLMA